MNSNVKLYKSDIVRDVNTTTKTTHSATREDSTTEICQVTIDMCPLDEKELTITIDDNGAEIYMTNQQLIGEYLTWGTVVGLAEGTHSVVKSDNVAELHKLRCETFELNKRLVRANQVIADLARQDKQPKVQFADNSWSQDDDTRDGDCGVYDYELEDAKLDEDDADTTPGTTSQLELAIANHNA